jgi:hypothetical protein
MQRLRLLCTNSTKGSASLKALAAALTQKLGYKVWRSTQQKPNREHLRYGHSVDKLTQYRWFQEQGLSALEFTTHSAEAEGWVNNGDVVFGRKFLNSSCGKGIVVYEPDGFLGINSPCPVYTKYKKKKREFRVHIFRDKVVAITEKRKRAGFEGQRDTKIRNLANGYVFCQTVENLPVGIEALALHAAAVTDSDFCGVDLGYNEKNNDLFVIEVNSAPGIQGSNINAYVEAITNAS